MRVIFNGKPVEVVITNAGSITAWWLENVPCRRTSSRCPAKVIHDEDGCGTGGALAHATVVDGNDDGKCLRSQCYWGVINFDHLHHYPSSIFRCSSSQIICRFVYSFMNWNYLYNSFINAYTIIYIHNAYIPTHMHAYIHACLDFRCTVSCIPLSFILYNLIAQECAMRHIWWYIYI